MKTTGIWKPIFPINANRLAELVKLGEFRVINLVKAEKGTVIIMNENREYIRLHCN